MAKGMQVFSHDAIRRRLGKVGGIGSPGPRDGKVELSPSNTKSAGSMLKKNVKPKGPTVAAIKRLSNGNARS